MTPGLSPGQFICWCLLSAWGQGKGSNGESPASESGRPRFELKLSRCFNLKEAHFLPL